MNVGDLRHRIDLQVPVSVQSQTTGELVDTWTSLGTVWASIKPLRGREAVRAGPQILADMDTRIRMRFNDLTATLTSRHRGIHQGTIFNFISVVFVNLEQREVEILAKSGVDDG